MKSAI
jgi:hypothetical protein